MPDRTAIVFDAAGNVVSTTTYPIPAEETNADTIRTQAQAAFTANRAYVATAAPTAAQTTAQVKALTRQVNGILRLVLNQYDGTD